MVDRKSIAWCITAALMLTSLSGGFAWAQNPGAGKPEEVKGAPAADLKTDKQVFSYAMGMQLGMGMRRPGLTPEDFDMQALERGLRDALAGSNPPISQVQLQRAVQAMFENAKKRKLEALRADPKWKAAAEKNKKDGEAFLAANKAKEGVKTLPSGLQYKVLASGNGATPTKADGVVAHYHGTFTDGKVFDSSKQRGEPATFEVAGVIAGWTEALLRMKEGDKWQLVVPSDLAYGEMGMGDDIGPNSTLVFEVELLKVLKQPGGAAGR